MGWDEYAHAWQRMADARFGFTSTDSAERVEVVRRNLRGDARRAALDHLRTQPGDALALVPELVGMALSQRTAGWSREALDGIQPAKLFPALAAAIPPLLDKADTDRHGWEDYRRLAELLHHVRAEELLARLVARAADSDDYDTREVAEDYAAGPADRSFGA
ncbi:hypothetical protein SUDANB95_00876 [Actinosynnema sp. ALI-1.44]